MDIDKVKEIVGEVYKKATENYSFGDIEITEMKEIRDGYSIDINVPNLLGEFGFITWLYGKPLTEEQVAYKIIQSLRDEFREFEEKSNEVFDSPLFAHNKEYHLGGEIGYLSTIINNLDVAIRSKNEHEKT